MGLSSQPLWGEEEEANCQHTFVSGPSIHLAFLSFNGTGTLHDPMAMSCFMLFRANRLLCKGYLESVYSIARTQNNSSKQIKKNKNSSDKLKKKSSIRAWKKGIEQQTQRKSLKQPQEWGRQTTFDWMSVAILILIISCCTYHGISPCPWLSVMYIGKRSCCCWLIVFANIRSR
jgi:hypothetical protein